MASKAREERRIRNRDIFFDTQKKVKNITDFKTVSIYMPQKYNSKRKTETKEEYKEMPIFIENINCIEAILKLGSKYKTCALNASSEKNKGGGVRNGADALEEALCRVSNLYNAIGKDDRGKTIRYPLHDEQILYSKNVTFIKDEIGKDLDKYVKVDVVSAAAIRRPEIYRGKYKYDEDREYMRIKLDTAINEAYKNKVEVLILCAWGCGAFKNPKSEVAEIFRDLLFNKYNKCFKKIVFAILEYGEKTPLNDTFKEYLK